ncbi:MAG: ABC transporter permease [Myxococcota bacterium]
MIWSTTLIALKEIRRNTMRSLLTMLGIVIGVGAVITMVMLGDGATASVTDDISAMGENMLFLSPGASRRRGVANTAKPLTEDDAIAIRQEVPGLAAVAPSTSTRLLVVYGSKNWRTTVHGTTPEYFSVTNHPLARGRFMNEAELSAGRPVCVIGESVRSELFGSGDPLQESIRVGTVSCRIVGLLEKKASNSFQDPNDIVAMPLRTFQRRIVGRRDVATIYMSAADGRSTKLVKSQVELLMRERRRLAVGDDNDFNVRDMQEILQTLSSVTGVLTALLGGIAAVSLLVGGIGIMNIMLVSVTERTREIGIRLAIGARGREVLLQFLIEAIVLSLIGGLIGIVFGLGLGYAASTALDMPTIVSARIIALSFVFSGFVGVFFGFIPARKAARLNPIDALRHE